MTVGFDPMHCMEGIMSATHRGLIEFSLDVSRREVGKQICFPDRVCLQESNNNPRCLSK